MNKVTARDATINALKEEIAGLNKFRKQQAEQIASLKDERTFWYNQGYLSGHHDTVEGCYTDIVASDMETYHQDIVNDIISELAAQPQKGEK